MRVKDAQKMERVSDKAPFKVICIDDEIGVINSLKVYVEKMGYEAQGYVDHFVGIEKIKEEKFDLLILDYLLDNINGDQVVKMIREFNKDIYILLLTGHAESAPPLETLENNNIQGYCTKSNDTSQLLLMVKSAYKSVQLMKEVKRTRDGLNNILKSLPMVYQLQPIDVILEQILNSLFPLVGASDAFILVDNVKDEEESKKESFFQGTGRFDTIIDNISSVFSPQLMEYAGSARTLKMSVKNEEGIFIPLTNEQNKSMGVIYIEVEGEYDTRLLEIFSIQVASSVNNAFLHSLVNIKNEELNKTYEIIKNSYQETINTLRLTVDARDEYTRGHSDRVSCYAAQIGRCFKQLNSEDIELLKVGGIFHDIGKIGTSDDILLADRRLTGEEFEIIKKHPLTGANILSALSVFNNVVPLVKCHHEKMDGTGYPQGLKGDEIPFLARIITVADAFDAMSSNRMYRKKLDLEDALTQLESGAGNQFDSEIVSVFVQAIRSGEIEVIDIEMR